MNLIFSTVKTNKQKKTCWGGRKGELSPEKCLLNTTHYTSEKGSLCYKIHVSIQKTSCKTTWLCVPSAGYSGKMGSAGWSWYFSFSGKESKDTQYHNSWSCKWQKITTVLVFISIQKKKKKQVVNRNEVFISRKCNRASAAASSWISQCGTKLSIIQTVQLWQCHKLLKQCK